MKKHIFPRVMSFLLAVFLAFAGALPAEAGTGSGDMTVCDYTGMKGWPAAPEITAQSAYMIELNTGAVLYSKDGSAQSFPASTTKIMTALLTLENCDLDDIVTLSHNAVTDLESGGNHWEFQEGEQLSVNECLQFLMVESVNEVAYALAEHISGSVAAFADMMNQRAKELGAENTHFCNPHGLNDDSHYTTAKDMAMILWGCVRNEKFQMYASLPSVSLKGRKIMTDGFSTYTNHDLMLLPSSEYYDADVVCGKTGYTSIAGNTLVTYARRGNMDVVCVLMKGGSDRFTDCRKLLDYAFDNFEVKRTDDVSESLYGRSGIPSGMKETAVTGDWLLLPKGKDWSKVQSTFTAGTGDNGVIGTRTWTYGRQTLGVSQVALTAEDTSSLAVSAASSGETQAETSPSGTDAENAGAQTSAVSGESSAAGQTVSGQDAASGSVQESEGTAQETYFGFTVKELVFLAVLAVIFIFLIVLLVRVIREGRRARRRRRRRGRRR